MSTITKRQIYWHDQVLFAATFDGTIVEYATLHNLKNQRHLLVEESAEKARLSSDS